MLTTITLTLALISTTPLRESNCWVDQGVGNAPANVEPRKDLPKSIEVDGKILIDKDLSQYLSHHLRCLWQWPEVCQTILNGEKAISDARINDLNSQLARAGQIGIYEPIPHWVWVVGGFVGGAFVGLTVGIVIERNR